MHMQMDVRHKVLLVELNGERYMANVWPSEQLGWTFIGLIKQNEVMGAATQLTWIIAGIAAISIATPLVSPVIFARWFSFPNIILLLPIPAATGVLFWVIYRSLQRLPVRLGSVPASQAALILSATVCQ